MSKDVTIAQAKVIGHKAKDGGCYSRLHCQSNQHSQIPAPGANQAVKQDVAVN